MKKLIEFLLPVCFHEWETEEKLDIFWVHPLMDSIPEEETRKLLPPKYRNPVGYSYILRCKKCGKIKKQSIYF